MLSQDLALRKVSYYFNPMIVNMICAISENEKKKEIVPYKNYIINYSRVEKSERPKESSIY